MTNEMNRGLLLTLFRYDPSTGWLIRKTGITKGKIYDGSRTRIRVLGNLQLTHRIIWMLHYGTLPRYLDHKDRDPGNNKIENLRPCTRAQNRANSHTPVTNRSGLKGVSWRANQKLWCAQIGVDKAKIHIGYFKSKTDAHNAYCKEAKKHFGEYFHDGLREVIENE